MLYEDTFDLFTLHLVAFLFLKPPEVRPEVSLGSPIHHLLYLLCVLTSSISVFIFNFSTQPDMAIRATFTQLRGRISMQE